MHYPLHITVLFTTLWILRDDAYAVKTGFNAEVLTSFAKNVASILSSTLLGEYQDQSANQLSSTLLKKIQDDPPLLNTENLNDPSSESSKSSSRQLRHARSSKEVRGAFQDGYVMPHPSGHSKYYNAESHEYAVNPGARISNEGKSAKNVNVDTKGNSIDADINAASVYYSNRHEHSPRLRITNPVHPSVNSNPYGHPAFQPRYHHSTPQSIEGSASVDGNAQAARITRRPFNLNYHAYVHPQHTFDRDPGFYPYGRPIEGNGQPSPSASGQDESNPSRLIDDQNQGQTALGGYDYSPHFHYKPPYYGGFYHGFPAFPFDHRNASFDHGNGEHPGGNATGGFVPYGPPIFPDYKFNPYFPYHSTFPPYFNGHRRPADPQNPPDNAENGEQSVSAENGQTDANGTMGHRPPYGFVPYGPFYGDFYLPKYPLTFHGYPYHFHHGFHNFPPYFKPGPYVHFPLFHSYPYFAPYFRPHFNGRGHMMADKPMQDAKMTDNAESPPTNDQAEMISESKADIVRYEKSASSWPFGKDIKKISDRVQLEETS
nr:PREDICTED: uncharacterized protein LOC105661777 [Megachile rotundata]